MQEDLTSYISDANNLPVKPIWDEYGENVRAFHRFFFFFNESPDNIVDAVLQDNPLIVPEGESVSVAIERMLNHFFFFFRKISDEASRMEILRQENQQNLMISNISRQCVQDAERLIPGITIREFIRTLRSVPTNDIDIQASAEDSVLYPSDVLSDMIDSFALYTSLEMAKIHSWDRDTQESFHKYLLEDWGESFDE